MSETKRQIVTVADVRGLLVAEEGKAQRAFNPGHPVFKKDFDRNAVRITVSARDDGRMYIIDGQHSREFALRNKDYGPYEVEAFYGLTGPEEADLFLKYNDAKPVAPVDKFRARVARGDSDAVGITEILRATGWKIQCGDARGSVSAIATVEKLYQSNPEALHKVFSILQRAWDGDPEGSYNTIVRALGQTILHNRSAVDEDHFVKVLSKVKPVTVRAEAASISHSGLRTIGKAQAVEEVLVSLYNRNKKNGRIEVSK